MPGIECVLTGEDARRWTQPFTAAIKSPIEHWCLAVDRVRYAGEPVAMVVADNRYRAEDALEAALVEIAVTSKNASVRAVGTSSVKHGVADLRRRLALNAQTSQSELSLPDAVQ